MRSNILVITKTDLPEVLLAKHLNDKPCDIIFSNDSQPEKIRKFYYFIKSNSNRTENCGVIPFKSDGQTFIDPKPKAD